MKITGELLRAARIKQDFKIADIAFALKLSAKVIQAIESGDDESLPAKTFVRGFVKSYAEYLKLDSVVVLKQFQEEMGSTSPVPKSPPPMSVMSDPKLKPKKENEPVAVLNEKINTGLTKKHIFIFASVSLFVVFLAMINHFINKYSKERIENIVTAANSKIQSVQQQPVPPADMSQTVPNSQSSAPGNVISADATTAPIQNQEPVTAYAANAISSGKPVEIIIEAKKDLTIQYAKGNSVVFEKVFIKENSYQVIRSTAGLHLRTEDGSNLILTVNGVIKPVDKSKPLQLAF